MSTGRALRLPDLTPRALFAAGLPPEGRLGDVVVVPMNRTDAVLVAMRDRVTGPYSTAERAKLERIAADAARAMAATVDEAGPGRRGSIPPASSSTALLDVTSAGIWITDLGGQITYTNQAACELVGEPTERLIGAPIDDFVTERAIVPGPGFDGTQPCDRRLVRSDGTVVWASETTRPLFDARGQRHATLHTLIDVTERRQREVQQRIRLDSEEALGRLAELALTEPDTQVLGGAAVRLIATEFGAPLVTLATISEERAELTIWAAAGELSDAAPALWRGRHPLPSGSATSISLATGDPVVTRGPDDPRCHADPIATAAGARSFACVPFAGAAACIALCRRDAEAIGDQELALLGAVARLLSARWPSPAALL